MVSPHQNCLTNDTTSTVAEMQALVRRSEAFASNLQSELDRLRQDTDHAVSSLNSDLQSAGAELDRRKQMERIDLIGMKTLTPDLFDGAKLNNS